MICQLTTFTHPFSTAHPFLGTINFEWVTTNRVRLDFAARSVRRWPNKRLEWAFHSRRAVQVQR